MDNEYDQWHKEQNVPRGHHNYDYDYHDHYRPRWDHYSHWYWGRPPYYDNWRLYPYLGYPGYDDDDDYRLLRAWL